MHRSAGLGHRLGRDSVGQDASDQIGVAILFVASDLAVPEMNHEDVVVVVSLAVASKVFAASLQHDVITAVDQAGRDRGALDKDAMEGTEDLVDDRLLADELAAPRALADGAPDDVVMARLPEGSAVAPGDFVEDRRDELGVG